MGRKQQSRGYDYRKHQAEKVQKQRREIWNRRCYYPTMCVEKVSKDGQTYFTEGSRDDFKQCLKKTMNRRFRRYGVDERHEISGKSRVFRRAFNYDRIWY